MNKCVLLSLILLLLTSSVTAKEVTLIKGMTFRVARQKLLNAGWLPHVTANASHYQHSDLAAGLLKARILEIEGCAMDRLACVFSYQKAGQCLRLFTEAQSAGVESLRITGWSEQCATDQ